MHLIAIRIVRMRDPLISPTHISRQCWAWTSLLAILFLGFLLGCQPDESPFKFENETLRKQIAKQESLIQSLQDGNQVMQEQINLLNRELREAQGISKVAEAQQSQMTTKMEDLVKKNKKLLAQFNWVKKKNSRAQYSVTLRDNGGQRRELLYPLAKTSKAAQEALSHNGYTLLLNFQTDKKSVFITDRKISSPRSLETAGFRNQYVLSLNPLPSKGTLLTVKADFEKMGQGGRILQASKEERADIERRLIIEISKKLKGGQTGKKK